MQQLASERSGSGLESLPTATETDQYQSTPPLQRLYDRNFVLALASQTCFVIANTLMAHYARWIEFLNGNLQQVGLVMGAGAFLGLVLRPWMALLIDRFGAKSLWCSGYLVFAASSIANLLLVDVGPGIYVIRSALVLGAAIVFSSSLTYISQIAPPRRQTEAIGILGVGGFLGMLVGPMLGDLLLGANGRDRSGFAALFVTAAVANLVALGLLYALPRNITSGASRSLSFRDFVATSRRHWPGTILLVDFAFGICMTGPFIFLATYIDKLPIKIAGFSEIGIFFWCYATSAIVLRVGLRRLPDRIGSRRVLLAGAVMMSLGMTAFSWVGADHPWRLVLPAVLAGAGHGLMFHTMTSLTVASFPHEVRGTGSVWALMMLDLGIIVGAPILGLVAERFGFETMFVVIGAVCVVSTMLYWAASTCEECDHERRLERPLTVFR